MKYPREFDEICINKCKKITSKQLELIGQNIKKLRLKNKLTQSDVSFYIFSDKSIISSIERGVQKNVTLLTLVKIAELFELELEDLLRED